ncbi:hypothetical protein ACFVP3_23420 [Streptomyces sp. NPDC057806]|uniref:hypothetical protein n=1 Tax=Streptomyces sp. NPDC057806 TaxID=3346255 RepID=UPI0036CBB993
MSTTGLEAELRTAAARLRGDRNLKGGVDCASRELLEMIRILLRAREPLAGWFDEQARYVASSGMYDVLALDVARAINDADEPGPGEDGHIADRLNGRSLYDQLIRLSGEDT